jgi:WD40 repeat protein
VSGQFPIAFEAGGRQFNPYPGLRPFEPEEDYLFFGRERQTDDLLRKLRTTRFLAILGSSGSGKSSLVRSGLIPTLWGGGMTQVGSRWRVVIMRPGEDPIANLAAALSARGALIDDDPDENLTRAFFETTLRASSRGLVECIEQARMRHRTNVLLLVDQFEEIFRYQQSRRVVGRDEAVAFVKLLLAARESDVPCYIAITMRSDFIGDCMEFGSLPEAINEGLYLVPRMTREELKSAITGPAGVGGGTIAPRLVSRLLNDVGDDPDQLPLLQHALMRSWTYWTRNQEPGEALDLRHYEAVGTLHGALSRHAEEASAELNPRQRKIAERLFKALTDRVTDPRGVRRPATIGEISAVSRASVDEVIAVVEIFRRPGRSFLTPAANVPLHESSVIDLSHESLMRIWHRLSTWAGEEMRAGQLYLNVARAAQRHQEGVVALWRDPELQLALTWRANENPTAEWAARYDPSFERAMAFLDASREERDREVREGEVRRQRQLSAARRLVAVLTLATGLMLIAGVYAVVQKMNAEAETRRAASALEEALIARRTADRQRERAQHERERADRVAEGELPESETLRLGRLEAARALALTIPQQKEENQRTTAALLALEAYRLFHDNRGDMQDRDLFTAMQTALDHLRPAPALRGNHAAIRSVAVAPGGRTAFGGAEDGRIVRFRLDSGEASPFASAAAAVRTIAMTGDGKRLVAGSTGGELRVFEVRDPSSPRQLGDGSGVVSAVAIAPRGPMLAAGKVDGSVRVWNLDAPFAAPLLLVPPGGKRVTAVAFDRNDNVAVGLAQGGALIWDLDGPSAPPRSVCAGLDVRSVAFRPDGGAIICGGARGQIVHQDLGRGAGAPLSRFGHRASVNALSFDARGDVLASASSDGTVRLWQVRRPEVQPIVLSGHDRPVWSVAFSGNRLVSGGDDRTVRLWPANTDTLAADLCRATENQQLTREEWTRYMPADVPYTEGCPAGQ